MIRQSNTFSDTRFWSGGSIYKSKSKVWSLSFCRSWFNENSMSWLNNWAWCECWSKNI